MKQGLRLLLPVRFDGVSVSDISKIEFVFAQDIAINNTIRKTSLYDRSNEDVMFDDGIFYVPWTPDETYLFKAQSPFYMDTRITLTNSDYQPQTNIVELVMNPTLFARRT